MPVSLPTSASTVRSLSPSALCLPTFFKSSDVLKSRLHSSYLFCACVVICVEATQGAGPLFYPDWDKDFQYYVSQAGCPPSFCSFSCGITEDSAIASLWTQVSRVMIRQQALLPTKSPHWPYTHIWICRLPRHGGTHQWSQGSWEGKAERLLRVPG